MTEKREAITLSVKPSVYGRFKKHCDEFGYRLSWRVEVLMKKDMEVSR